MKNILVPVDFSAVSKNTEDYAVALAKVFGAQIHLLHVYRDIMPATVGPEPWSITMSEKRVDNEKLINKELEYLKTKYGIEVKAEVETGNKAKVINATAKKVEASLIVMGVHGGKRYRILGSTVLNTIRKTKRPVLIIPEGVKFVPIKNIVLAVDFAEMLQGSSFEILLDICKKFDTSIRVLHMEHPDADFKVSEVAEKIQLGLALSHFNYQYDKAEGYNVEEAISGYINRHPVDLLVLMAHHHTIYERVFETIHTREISLKIKQPLLVLKHQ